MSRILYAIRGSERLLSRADLGRLIDLNKSTVSSLVDELIASGFIKEVGENSTKSGRPSTLLTLNPDLGLVIGIEMGVTVIKIVLANVAGQIVWRGNQVINPVDDKSSIIQQILFLVDCAMDAGKKLGGRFLGLGITLPGLVNVYEGVLDFAPNLAWRDISIKELLETHTGLPVQVENDAHAAALGEHFFGIATQNRNFIFIILDSGVGSGLLFNGEIFRGAQGFAGQLGHTLFMNDKVQLCRCGNPGCFETTCNLYSVMARMNERIQIGRQSMVTKLMAEMESPLTFEIIIKAADMGDNEAQEVLKETGKKIGVGLVNLVNLFNPEKFVIGGKMSMAGAFLIPEINKTLKRHKLSENQLLPPVEVSNFGSEASVMGAVALVAKYVLENPRSVSPLPDPSPAR